MLTASIAPVRILLAEDNPGDVRLFREALKFHQVLFHLDVVDDGEKAIGYVDKLGLDSNRSPDLIFLDLNLPKTDKLDILKLIKATPRVRDVPVVILSSSESPQDRADTERLGAARFILKPSTLDEFMEIGALAKQLISGDGH